MVTKEDLERKYKNLSNSELLNIIENKFNYTELAVIVALEEISRRNITEKDISKFKKEKIKEAEEFVVKNIVDDLTFFQKIFYYFLWLPFFTFAFRANLYHDGYILKYKQANYYSWLGFLCVLFVSILDTKFEFSFFVFLIIWMILFIPCYYFDEFFNRNVQIKKLRQIYKQNGKENLENKQ
jgi:hypothetical protein